MSTIKADNILPIGQTLNVTSTLFVNSANKGVGIATSIPGASLDVNGTLKVSGGVTFDGTSDHTGVARFRGNVSVNTSNPDAELHVKSSLSGAHPNSGIYIQQAVGAVAGSKWQLLANVPSSGAGGATAFQIIDRTGAGVRRAVFGTDGRVCLGGNISSDSGADAILTLTSGGNVGIGTLDPYPNAVKLQVEGIIQAGVSPVGGSVILVGGSQTGSYSYPQVLNLIGSESSSGSTLLTYGLRPKGGTYGFESTHTLSPVCRAALKVGATSRESDVTSCGMVLYADKSGAHQGSIGDDMDARLKPIFRCDTTGMYYKGASTYLDGHVINGTNSNVPLYIRYKGNNIGGTFVIFQAATTTSTEAYTDPGNNVGSISCATTGVLTYNTFCGTHWSYNTDEETEILPGTVMETISEQHANHLPKCKICKTVNAPSVYGVYSDLSELNTETPDPRKISVASLGAFFVRIASGSEVSLGDLLVCDGNGCAVSQGDDIIRSCTIGKVTSTVKLKEYADGSYTVPAVLYCG